MDPICHTLVGATLGTTGLEKRTRYGRAALIIGANLPDIDAIAHFWGYPATYAFRRGITHGLPALFLLPVLLALLLLGFDRLKGPAPDGRRADLRWLFVLSAIGVLSHPSLDWLNNYGMRWLMPFVDRWFYGDTLFIIDWFAWLVLAAALLGAWLRRHRTLVWYVRPASVGLALLVAYVGMNAAVTAAAENAAFAAHAGNPPRRLMASPVPLNPFVRDIVLDFGTEYRFAEYRVFDVPGLHMTDLVIPVGDPDLLERSKGVREGRWFLRWARFPFVVAGNGGDDPVLILGDARYVRDVDKPRLRDFGILALDSDALRRGTLSVD